MNGTKNLRIMAFPSFMLFDGLQSIFLNIGLITIGSIVFVIGMHSLLIPQHFVSGGITGLAMLAHYRVASLDVGASFFVLNLPLLLLGWFTISRRFILYTIFGMGFFSLAAKMIRTPVLQIDDPLLAAVFAGAICGIGGGLILRSVGSAGGFDVLGIYINQRFGLRPGIVVFVLNLLPLVLSGLLYSLEIVLYSVIYSFVYGKIVDVVVTGMNQRKSVLIVSKHSHEIAHYILDDVKRGVTFLKGEGAYSGEAQDVILTISTLHEAPRLKAHIFSIDPKAFVVVNDTLEVLGQRHGQLKVY